MTLWASDGCRDALDFWNERVLYSFSMLFLLVLAAIFVCVAVVLEAVVVVAVMVVSTMQH